VPVLLSESMLSFFHYPFSPCDLTVYLVVLTDGFFQSYPFPCYFFAAVSESIFGSTPSISFFVVSVVALADHFRGGCSGGRVFLPAFLVLFFFSHSSIVVPYPPDIPCPTIGYF